MPRKPRTYACRRYTSDGAVLKQSGLTMDQAKVWAYEVGAIGLEISRGFYEAAHIETTMQALKRAVGPDRRFYLRKDWETGGPGSYHRVPKTEFERAVNG